MATESIALKRANTELSRPMKGEGSPGLVTLFVIEKLRPTVTSLGQICAEISQCSVVGSACTAELSVAGIFITRPLVVMLNAPSLEFDPLGLINKLDRSGVTSRYLVVLGPADYDRRHKYSRANIQTIIDDREPSNPHSLGLLPRELERVIAGWGLDLEKPSGSMPERERLLTNAERKIVGFLGAGASNAELAVLFGVSEGTSQVHRKRILAKLGMYRSADLFVYNSLRGLTLNSHILALAELRLRQSVSRL